MTETASIEKSNDSDSFLLNIAASRVRWEIELARTEQVPDNGDWQVWLYLAGRGTGKTRTAAEWLVWQAIRNPSTRWAVIARTFSDARDTCAEGESGLLTILRRYGVLKAYNRSIGEIKLTNGSLIKLFSAEEPDRLRGPQFHGAWCDELAAWNYPDAWDMLQFGLRLGHKPQTIVTTTPQPKPLIKQLLKQADDGSVRVVRGTTFDNAHNLPKTTLEALRAKYEGTRLGRQELYAEVLDDVEGALFTFADIDNYRVAKAPELTRIVIGVDPALTATEQSDETGIVVVAKGTDGRAYVLDDRSCQVILTEWARRVVNTYHDYEANVIAAEKTAGDTTELLIRQISSTVPIKMVTAKKAKEVRAEPVAALYQQGRVSHVGVFERLESQMTEWVPKMGMSSPDRLDALVYGITELGIGNGSTADAFLQSLAPLCENCGHPNPTDASACSKCSQQFKPTVRSADNFLTMNYPR